MAALATTAAALTVVAVSQGTASPLPAVTNGPAPTGIIAPAQVPLPPVPAQVLGMSEAGVSDALITSYIRKSANSYSLDAAQIIYLHDLGVSSAVLKSLVEHEAAAGSTQAAETASGAVVTQNPAPTSSPPPVSGMAANYYAALAPYGTWVNVRSYGWCWQPTVEVVNPAWQPYCDNGCWLWTDQGWFWNSYYSWGWAPFHYGRWYRYPNYGWLWRPDDVWGPAWVCWRDYPGYCGWAPLPPQAGFTVGVGWTFNGMAVGYNFGFGLGARCFTFCNYDDFCRPHPFDDFRRGHEADRFFDHSRVDNDFDLDAHHHFINRGIAPSRIEAATHRRIGQVAVREWSRHTRSPEDSVMPDRLTWSGKGRVIYRPGPGFSFARYHFPFNHHVRAAGHRDNFAAEHGISGGHEAGHGIAFESVHSAGLPHSPQRLSLKHLYGSRVDPHRDHLEGLRRNHVLHGPEFQREHSDSSRLTPGFHSVPSRHPAPAHVWHSAPTWHTAPTWHSAPVQRSASTWHSAPARHFAPARDSVHVWHSSPARPSVRAWHTRPSPSRGGRSIGSERHFSGGTTHFGGARATGHSRHK